MRISLDQAARITLLKMVSFSLVTVLATVALAATIRNGTPGDGHTYAALFTDATSLNPGDDVRMAGVKVGTVERIEVADDRVAKVWFNVSDSAPLTDGTTVLLRFRNVIGQRYVALQAPPRAGRVLPVGHTFDLDHTTPALDLTLLFNGFQPLFQFLDPHDVNELSGQIISVFQGEGGTVDSLLSSTARLTSTLADRDQVIGEMITSLNQVLSVVGERSGQLDTTLVTLQRLVSGLAQDRTTIGDTIAGMSDLSASVASLLRQGRDPLRRSIKGLGDLSHHLATEGPVLDRFLARLPTKLSAIGRTASYGSWVNFYLCSIKGSIPLPEGYYGDLGVRPVAGRCR
ncbi:MCE family protein [Nocardioides ginsengisoli]|uniref:MCE family protein n=1 Tax=Nocardioides ginsengisoli TaxID=363868 RepID=A0ABW3W078_9ACTN